MQTFLPYPDFVHTASCLDRRRLGKQRVEAMQILKGNGWANHPAVKMWRGYEKCLAYYLECIINEWVGRGYRNNIVVPKIPGPIIPPPWMTDDRFHASHRAALLWKEPTHYQQFGWTETPQINYWWPIT